MKNEIKPWRNRIVGEGEEDPEQLLANPLNYRVHSKHQQAALGGVLNEIGWVQRVIVNHNTGHVVDGHARVGMAIARGEKSVPVVYVDLTLAEEKLVLATLDPISALAGTDREILAQLLLEVDTSDEALQKLLDDTAKRSGVHLSELEDMLSQADDAPIAYQVLITCSSEMEQLELIQLLSQQGLTCRALV